MISGDAHHVLCALTSPYGEIDADAMLSADWDEVVAVANRHYLVPALHCALRDRALLHLLPEVAADYVGAVYALNAERNAKLYSQLEAVVRCLNMVAVKPVLIKGAASLVEKWVPDPASRFMFDLDILVSEDEGECALSALQSAGYCTPRECQQPTPEEGNHHYPPLQKEGEPALVELHIRPLSRKSRPVVTTQTLMDKAKMVSVGEEASAWLPEPSEQLLLMFLHSEVSHENHRFALLDIRHAWDIPWFCCHHADSVDWNGINRRVSMSGYQLELTSYLRLLNGFFSMPLPLRLDESASEAERHYRRVCRMFRGGGATRVLMHQFVTRLRFLFSREMIEKRYGSGQGVRLQLNRGRYLLYLLNKYRKQASWRQLVHPFRLRMRDNAGR